MIGKHQSVAAEADKRFLDEKGITLARRFSGGGAVYHGTGEILTLSLIETVNSRTLDITCNRSSISSKR